MEKENKKATASEKLTKVVAIRILKLIMIFF